MKYSFNEKELLDLFVSNDDSLPLFMHPYLKDGYVCATDNSKIIRIKADALNGEYEPTDRMNLEWPNESCDYIMPGVRRHRHGLLGIRRPQFQIVSAGI